MSADGEPVAEWPVRSDAGHAPEAAGETPRAGSAPRRASGVVPDVVAFDEPLDADLDPVVLLGGKGAGLAEMTRSLGLPVPPGFTITTDVCRRYLAGGWPAGFDAQIARHLDRLAERLGRRFGDPHAPLLVSVRSGAPVSMPGMMDTVLNVGMTPEICERLAEESGSATFAADTWLRFHRAYAEIVLGIPRAELDRAAGAAPAGVDAGDAGAMLVAAERVRRLAERHPGGGILERPHDQLRGAIEAVFRSWQSERARFFRAREGIPDGPGTAATVQAMVFGNLDDRSGTGVVFTRDPATGEPEPYGDYLPRAQGEDVVAGGHTVDGLERLRRQLPATYEQLRGVLERLERHYRDMCDVEFTVSAGRLYLLQTRVGRRSPLAAVRVAVAMAADPDFPLSREEAVARIDGSILRQVAEMGRVDPAASPLATGLAASPGVGAGALCCDPDRAAEMAARGVAVVLAREETSPADVHGMVGAAGLVTTRGGVASHAAVVARGWAIPAVTSLRGAEIRAGGLAVGDTWIAEGEQVTVDGTAGSFYLGDRHEASSAEVPEVLTLREWAAELGVEPGSKAEAAPAGVGGADVTLMQIARTIQLKGLCTEEQAARILSAPVAAVAQAIESHPVFFRATPRGVMPTPECREWLEQQLAAERAIVDPQRLETGYWQFRSLNDRFKRLVSEWQMSPRAGSVGSAGPASGWPELLDSLAQLHAELTPLIEEASAHLPRLRCYRERLDGALAGLRAGDASLLAAPLKDSYHTVWFEYHEELLALLGRDRAIEERAEAGDAG